jgi:uncharacterized LabA/DUF88 family protein
MMITSVDRGKVVTDRAGLPLEGVETAILIDLENLFGGYKPENNFSEQVDLKKLMHTIEHMSMVGRVAVKRAYAHWAHPFLTSLRSQVADLGIEPVQMFSLGKGNAKNASDLQIAIDAMDLALTRPSIQGFLIISGDGGFASLACRLRSHGKLVGGAAYDTPGNGYFQKQCDEWTALGKAPESKPGPKKQRIQASKPTPPWATKAQPRPKTDVASKLLTEFLGRFIHTSPEDCIGMQAATASAVNTVAGCPSVAHLIDGQGLEHMHLLGCLKEGVKDFSAARAGVPKMSKLLALAVTGTDVQLIQGSSGQLRIQRRELKPPGGFELVDDLEGWDVHTAVNYRDLLASASRWVPSEITLGQAADLVIASGSEDSVDEQALAETIIGTLACTDKDAKTSLRVLTAAGVVRRSAGDSGSRLTVLTQDPAEARRLLTVHLQEQMASLLPDYRVDVLEELVG